MRSASSATWRPRRERLQLASGILQIYSRTPTLTAMTAAGLDYVSGGRFVLGIGASGPQVIEGWHGVPYDAPVGRTREIIEICRAVWRRERLEYAGRHYTIPLPPDQGTGLGKPLKLINHPVRDRIPIVVAALGPKNVAMAAELAEGWEPIFYLPEKAAEVWADSLAAGAARRDPSLPPLDVIAQAQPGHRRRRARAAGIRPADASPVHRRDGRPRPQLLQRPGLPLRLRAKRRPRSRTPTSPGARTRPRPWSRPRCWRAPR